LTPLSTRSVALLCCRADLGVLLQSPVPASAVRDTIARIVLERGYQRSVTSTLLSRFWDWVTDVIGRLFAQAAGSRGTYMISLTLLTIVILVSVVRAMIVARARRLAANRRDIVATADEELAQARALAAQGAFAEAAHRLYAATVTRLVEARRVRRHPSKTVGDYGRELRAASDALTAPYRAFAGTYEIVAYGDGTCDAVRYARLEQLAAPLLQTTEAPVARAA
jgi:Domain of unknown function (DUF4129)